MVLIVTYRPEFEPPWIGRSYITALSLNRLDEREIGAMIDRVAGNNHCQTSVRQDIIERTDGIPLFVEGNDEGDVGSGKLEGDARKTAAAVPSSAIAVPAEPACLADGAARPARPCEREMAQIGAVIGREFSHALLAAVAHKDGENAAGLVWTR